MKNETYRCGHELPESIRLNLGRGQSRQRRSASLAEIDCTTCRIEHYKEYVNKLTRIGGEPLPSDVKERKINTFIRQLTHNYN